MRLWHYTCCDHGQVGIERDGVLRPNRHPWLSEPLVWVTDLDEPHALALGLTSFSLFCDRTAIRYELTPEAVELCVPWWRYARTIPPMVRRAFESAPGVMPRHWWVSTVPLPVVTITSQVRPWTDADRAPATSDLRGDLERARALLR